MEKDRNKKVRFVWKDFIKDIKRLDAMALAIIRQRGIEIYSANWAVMSKESLISAAAYKCERARFTVNLEKQLDDVLDAMNYLRFYGIRLLALMDEIKRGAKSKC